MIFFLLIIIVSLGIISILNVIYYLFTTLGFQMQDLMQRIR